MSGDPGSGGGQRVSERHGAAARVELLRGEVQRLLAGQRLGRECLVDLDLQQEEHVLVQVQQLASKSNCKNILYH